MKTIQERIAQARLTILLQYPFLGFILQHIDVYEKEDLGTAATDGRYIYYDAKFMNELSDEALIFILLHELLHIILFHPSRGYGKNHHKFNIACDIVVNDILIGYDVGFAELSPVIGRKYLVNGMHHTAESIYDALPDKLSQFSFDFHGLWQELSPKHIQDIQRILSQAVKSSSNTEIDLKLMETLNIGKPSQKSWRKILKSYLIQDIHDYNYSRTDKRFTDMILPSFVENEYALKDVWVVVDVSHSMGKEVSDVYAELMNMIQAYPVLELHLSFFSTKVTKPEKIRRIYELIEKSKLARTTGGTNFHCIFENIKLYFPNHPPKLIIILTDGYSFYPEENETHGIPVIWGINNLDATPPFGKIIRIGR